MWGIKKQILSGDTLSSTEEFKINKIRNKNGQDFFILTTKFFRRQKMEDEVREKIEKWR